MKPEILVIAPNQPAQMAVLDASYTLHRYDLASDPEALLAEVSDRIIGVVTTGGKGLNAEQIRQLPKLRIVASSGVGYDTIDIPACSERSIVVTNTPDVLTDDVADTAIMLVLAARRHLVQADRYVRSGDWGRNGPYPLLSAMRGKRLGIVGLGRIGQAIAARAAPMGPEIAYTGRTPKPDVDYRFEPDLKKLAAWADILIVATSGGADTQGLIGSDIISALGPQGTLINIARGSVVDETAMIAALKSGDLGAAGLDVYWNEPNIDPALWQLENTVLYPHHASATFETRGAMAQLVVDNLAAFFKGQPVLTPVN
ncbi:MAG: 2-hydroxyacid dehydrogenase [Hyphomicrobiales bacterium]